MQQAFIFNEVAITVRHWFEIGPEDAEHGCRIELRHRVPHPHRGSESASQLIELDRPIWRADLFDLVTGPPGNFERAHYHPDFDGPEPGPRIWDEGLTADPFGWAEAQLSDVAALVETCGHSLQDPTAETQDVGVHLDQILAAARRAAGSECRSPESCRQTTRDATEILGMMEAMFRGHLPAGQRDPRLPIVP